MRSDATCPIYQEPGHGIAHSVAPLGERLLAGGDSGSGSSLRVGGHQLGWSVQAPSRRWAVAPLVGAAGTWGGSAALRCGRAEGARSRCHDRLRTGQHGRRLAGALCSQPGRFAVRFLSVNGVAPERRDLSPRAGQQARYPSRRSCVCGASRCSPCARKRRRCDRATQPSLFAFVRLPSSTA